MSKDYYIRTMQAGRFVKTVRYKRSLPSDSKAARRAKSAVTCKAQRYINVKNAADKLELLLCANFDNKKACFCTLTFAASKLPATRKDAKALTAKYFVDIRKEWKRRNKDNPKYIYTIEGETLASRPDARSIDADSWELTPWRDRNRWENMSAVADQEATEQPTRFHVHCFLLLDKADYETVKAFWPYGHVYINPMKVNEISTFQRLACYVMKERRDGAKPNGDRAYIPSKNLEQPVTTGYWCHDYEAIEPPHGAELIESGREDTYYTSFQYCSYRLPRAQQLPQPYTSRGRLGNKKLRTKRE